MIGNDWIDPAEPPWGEATADTVLTLSFDAWEGPLDLLLTLARNQKVDLRAISILALVEQYLDYVEQSRALKLELAADYLVMAAWLAYLKSALLLPREEQPDPSPEELALRLQLRLQRLDAMREAGARLMARDRLGRDVFTRVAPEGLVTQRRTAWQASLIDLMAAYGMVQARARPVLHVVARRTVMTLEDAIDRLRTMVGSAVEWTDIACFYPAADDPDLSRSVRASSFVAALELARQRQIDLRQDEMFGPILVRASQA